MDNISVSESSRTSSADDCNLSSASGEVKPHASSSQNKKNRKDNASTTSVYQNKAKLEDQMNNENLELLQKIFEEADEDGGGGLDIEEFGCAMKMAFGSMQDGLDDNQLSILFMKVDTNCDGTVDWEEFCSYMLLENQQKDSMSRDVSDLPFSEPARELPSPHHDSIARLTYFPSLGVSNRHASLSDDLDNGNGRYVSCSKDGVLVFWGTDLTIQKTVSLSELNSHNKAKTLWVTDVVCLANVKKIAVSTTERDVGFYDVSATNFEKQFILAGLDHCVLCMDYWYNPRNLNESCLLLGDAGGNVSYIKFSNATVGLFDGNIGQKKDISTVTVRRIPFQELLCGRQPNIKAMIFNGLHEDWVRKVKYIPNLESFISCANTTNTSLCLGDLQRKKTRSFFRIKKGVYSFDYDKDNNVIVTGGIDCFVRLWNPYVTNKATSVLKGHASPVIQIVANGDHQQIISISKDRIIKLWDIRDHCCLQTIPSRFLDIGVHPITTVYYNHRNQTLLLGSNLICVLEKKCGIESSSDDEPTSHSKPLCGAIYNDLFNQVVSACHDSTVNVWHLDTGEKTIMFTNAHNGSEITAMSFDPTKRRLITGARDGSVKIWNFNNGACLRLLAEANDCEITGIVCPKQRIITVGWNRLVTIHRDLRESEDEPAKTWNKIHKDDILAADLYRGILMATSSYDGQLSVWNVDTGHVYGQVNMNQLPGSNTKSYNIPSDKTGDLAVNAQQHQFVDKIMFLQSRDQHKETATLLTSTGGLIQAWSTQGCCTLLGQFEGVHGRDECVLGMTTDVKNDILITGNSLGYITIWEISSYCIFCDVLRSKSPDVDPRSPASAFGGTLKTPLLRGLKKWKSKASSSSTTPDRDLNIAKQPPSVNFYPPNKLTSYRAHCMSIVSLDYVDSKSLVVSASMDGCVRLWSLTGRYIGTFGHRLLWDSLDNPSSLNKLPRRVPADVQRVASSNSLKILTGMAPRWKVAKNILHILQLGRRFTKPRVGLDTDEIVPSDTIDEGDDHITPTSNLANMQLENVLGKNYKPKQRHRMPPANIKPSLYYNQCIAYTSLPYSELQPMSGPHLPSELLQTLTSRQHRPSTGGGHSDMQRNKIIAARLSNQPASFSRHINSRMLPAMSLRRQ